MRAGIQSSRAQAAACSAGLRVHLAFALALLGFSASSLRIVDGGAIYFDPGDEEQPAFETCVGLALFSPFWWMKGSAQISPIRKEIRTFFWPRLLPCNGGQAFQPGADHFTVDVGVFHAVCRAMEGCDGYGEERFTSADRYLADAIEVADTGGVQVEIFGFLGLGVVARMMVLQFRKRKRRNTLPVRESIPRMGRYWEVKQRERLPSTCGLIDRATGSWCDLGFDLHGNPCRSLSDHDYWGGLPTTSAAHGAKNEKACCSCQAPANEKAPHTEGLRSVRAVPMVQLRKLALEVGPIGPGRHRQAHYKQGGQHDHAESRLAHLKIPPESGRYLRPDYHTYRQRKGSQDAMLAEKNADQNQRLPPWFQSFVDLLRLRKVLRTPWFPR